MSYTTARDSVTHIESDDYSSTTKRRRFHTYKCRACGGEMVWETSPYGRCPWCGMPVVLYRGTR